MAKLEKLDLVLPDDEKRNLIIVGIENFKNLKVFNLRGNIDDKTVELALEQVKTENENRSEANQIKVVVDRRVGVSIFSVRSESIFDSIADHTRLLIKHCTQLCQ